MKKIFRFHTLFKTDWIFNNLRIFIIIFFLIILYIRNGHWGDKLLRDISTIEKELTEIKINYKISKVAAGKELMENELSVKAQKLGLFPSQKLPFKIYLNVDSLQNDN